MRLVFLLGNDKKETQTELLKEQSIYKDLLIGEFQDSFVNLTFKDSMFLVWAKSFCEVAYIFKGTGT